MGTLERELYRPVRSVMNLSFLYVNLRLERELYRPVMNLSFLYVNLRLERELYRPVMNLSFLYVNHIFELRWIDVGKLCEWWWAET